MNVADVQRERDRHKGGLSRVLELMLLTEMMQLAYLASDLMRLLFLFFLNSLKRM